MIIIKAQKYDVIAVDTNEHETPHYIRFSEDNWMQWYGQSLEDVYHSEELEKAYQEYRE